jgi:hypothetical protein
MGSEHSHHTETRGWERSLTRRTMSNCARMASAFSMVLSMFSCAIVMACVLTCDAAESGSSSLTLSPSPPNGKGGGADEPGRGGWRPRSRRRGCRRSRGRRPCPACSPRSAPKPPAARSPAATAPPSPPAALAPSAPSLRPPPR